MTSWMRRSAARWAMSTAFLCTLLLVGCSSDPERETLFDHSHEAPDHWPRNLGDATVKIRQRLEQLDANDSDAASELTDLVSWTPEVAADTSMSEQQWTPIWEASEKLRRGLEKNKGTWDSENRQQVLRLCVLVDAAWSQLPEEERLAVRYQSHGHHHDHDHGDHDHDDHDHDDHDHSDHDHDGHDHDKPGNSRADS